MNDLGAEDLASWRDPDVLLEALHRLGGSAGAGEHPPPQVREAVQGLLDHEDPDVRQEAARLLLIALKDSAARNQALLMARSDDDDEVRGTAIYGIAGVSTPATYREDTDLLLQILLDKGESSDIRGCAYEGLLIIHQRPKFPPVNREFDPARDVDWAWVEELRRGLAEAPAGD